MKSVIISILQIRELRLHSWPVAEPALEPGKSGSDLSDVWQLQEEPVSGLAGAGGLEGRSAQAGRKGKRKNKTEIRAEAAHAVPGEG